jgi:hypothetical protein
MKKMAFLILGIILLNSIFNEPIFAQKKAAKSDVAINGFVDASQFGFSPEAAGIENTSALQKAVDQTGTIVVGRPGIYKMAGTVYIGSNTSLIFGNDIYLKKVDEKGSFTHVLLNKGALTKTYDRNIVVEGVAGNGQRDG